ncbi:MAG: SH3 domain-containing protein [Anaerolineae bacterium]|nr:SH3 domain-containing protein [Anaerolineae bacterium]
MKFTFLPILLALSLFSFPQPAAQPQGNDLQILAFYYSWYGEKDWADTRRMADFPVETYPYGDPSAIERHVLEGKAAGLDGFVMSWYGAEQGNPTDEHFRHLLKAAEKHEFWVGIDFDMGSAFSSSIETLTLNLRFMYANYLNHPNYLTYDGRPVVFFWNHIRFGRGEWEELRLKVDPHHDAIWIAEGVDPGWVGSTWDGLNAYNIAWAIDPVSKLQEFAKATRKQGGLWVATAMPGWDDTGLVDLRGTGSFAVPRRNGDYFRETFTAAIATQPDILMITSYNEWLEGSYLASSRAYGDFYVNLTHELINQHRRSIVEPPFEPEITDVQGQATTSLKLRSGPGQGYRNIGEVQSGETFPLLSKRENWILIEVNGQHGWVNYNFVQTLGDPQTVPDLWWYLPASERRVTADILAPQVGYLIQPASESVVVTSWPDETGEMIREITSEETLPITGVYRGYYRTDAGWVLAESVEVVNASGEAVDAVLAETNRLIPDETGIYAQATADMVIRQTPNGTRIAAFPFQAVAEAIGLSADGQWVQIHFTGVTGWVSRLYVTPHGDFKKLPVS